MTIFGTEGYTLQQKLDNRQYFGEHTKHDFFPIDNNEI